MAVPIPTMDSEEFAAYMLDIMNKSALSLLISIGHQLGLFDALAITSPTTSTQLAQYTNLNERYLREWLGGMTVGHIITYDPEQQTYTLPPAHAVSLTRDAGLSNMSTFTQYIPLLGMVEQQIIDCFRYGGGVPYAAYPRFQHIQAEETYRIFDALLINTILPLVSDLPNRLSQGAEILDVGCGCGHAINIMAQAFPQSKFRGYDISLDGITIAQQEAHNKGLTNVHFEVKDVAQLDEPDRYDLITAFDTIHDQARPATVLQNIQHSLKNNGIFLLQDIAASSNLEENLNHPMGPILFTFSVMHCMTVSLAYSGEGLGTVWGKQKALQMLKDAGFGEVTVKEVPDDILNYYYIVKR